MKEYLVNCENCNILFKSLRKKRFCGRKECNNDRARSRSNKKYKEDPEFRKSIRKNSVKYRNKKRINSKSDGLIHEVCYNCGKEYSYPIRRGMPRKYCSRIECQRDRNRKQYYQYVSNPDNRKKFNNICRKAHKKYHNKNREIENKKDRDYRLRNLKKERSRDKKRHKKDNERFLIKNSLPKDYIKEFKYEKLMKGILDKIFPNELHVDNKRFILTNNNKIRQTHPCKKNNFEFDRFYPKLKIVFEFDGIQHQKFTPYFHKTQEDFQYIIKKDKYKDEVCLLVGIKLIRVTFKELNVDIIRNKLLM